VFESLTPDKAVGHALELLELLQTAPHNLNRLLSDLADQRLVLPVRTNESAEDKNGGNTRARIIALSIISVSITLLAVGYHNSSFLGVLPLDIPLILILIAVYVWIAVLWRQAR
jgi:hypothetical protein